MSQVELPLLVWVEILSTMNASGLIKMGKVSTSLRKIADFHLCLDFPSVKVESFENGEVVAYNNQK